MTEREEPMPVDLVDLQFEDGFWTADNAPIYCRRKRSLQKIGTLSDLSLNDMFYVELWDGEFAGKCYFMKVVRIHEEQGYYDCLWLSKKRRLLRNIIGRAMYSCIAETTQVYSTKLQAKKRKKTLASNQPAKVVKKEPKVEQVPTKTPSGEVVTPRKEPFPSRSLFTNCHDATAKPEKSTGETYIVQKMTYL